MGIGTDKIECVPCDNQGRMQAEKMPDIDNNTVVLCQAGNLNSGVADLIDRCCNHAQDLADGLNRMGFEILNDVELNQVVAVIRGREADMATIATYVQNSGKEWFGTTVWKGTPAIRLSVSSWITTKQDINITLQAIREAVTITASKS